MLLWSWAGWQTNMLFFEFSRTDLEKLFLKEIKWSCSRTSRRKTSELLIWLTDLMFWNSELSLSIRISSDLAFTFSKMLLFWFLANCLSNWFWASMICFFWMAAWLCSMSKVCWRFWRGLNYLLRWFIFGWKGGSRSLSLVWDIWLYLDMLAFEVPPAYDLFAITTELSWDAFARLWLYFYVWW